MSKLKTNKSVYKRFKKNSSGLFRHKKTNLRHILTKKSSKRKRKLGKMKNLDKSNIKMIKKILIY